MKRALTVVAARMLIVLTGICGYIANHLLPLVDLEINALGVLAALMTVAFALAAMLFSARSHELWISRIECRVARF